MQLRNILLSVLFVVGSFATGASFASAAASADPQNEIALNTEKTAAPKANTEKHHKHHGHKHHHKHNGHKHHHKHHGHKHHHKHPKHGHKHHHHNKHHNKHHHHHHNTSKSSNMKGAHVSETNTTVGEPSDPNHSYNRTKSYMTDHNQKRD